MDYEQFLKLKHKQRIKVSIGDTYSKREMILEVGRRTKSKKYNVEKITLIPTNTNGELNTFACKYFLYARPKNQFGGTYTEEELKIKDVDLAHGNMAADLYKYEVL